jgi:hypothetical protein
MQAIASDRIFCIADSANGSGVTEISNPASLSLDGTATRPARPFHRGGTLSITGLR